MSFWEESRHIQCKQLFMAAKNTHTSWYNLLCIFFPSQNFFLFYFLCNSCYFFLLLILVFFLLHVFFQKFFFLLLYFNNWKYVSIENTYIHFTRVNNILWMAHVNELNIITKKTKPTTYCNNENMKFVSWRSDYLPSTKSNKKNFFTRIRRMHFVSRKMRFEVWNTNENMRTWYSYRIWMCVIYIDIHIIQETEIRWKKKTVFFLLVWFFFSFKPFHTKREMIIIGIETRKSYYRILYFRTLLFSKFYF